MQSFNNNSDIGEEDVAMLAGIDISSMQEPTLEEKMMANIAENNEILVTSICTNIVSSLTTVINESNEKQLLSLQHVWQVARKYPVDK